MIRKGLIASVPLIAIMVAIAVYGWIATPAGAAIPVHWRLDGTPDRYGAKLEGFALLPAIALGLTALFAVLPRIDPRGANLQRSPAPYLVAWIGVLAILTAAQAMLTLVATGAVSAEESAALMPRVVVVAVSLLFVALGNVLGKARPNWFVGVRTPWTLSSDYSWDKTHRLIGRLWVAAGVLSVVAALFAPAPWLFAVLLTGVLGSALVAVVMSYVWWRRDPVRETRSASVEGD